MNMREARQFIASVPCRQVKDEPVTMTRERVAQGWVETAPDPHQYVIKGWREVDADSFDAFVRLIKTQRYRATYSAPYRPDHVMTNHYLEIDGWCYWFICPKMLNRERADPRLGEVTRLFDLRRCRFARGAEVPLDDCRFHALARASGKATQTSPPRPSRERRALRKYARFCGKGELSPQHTHRARGAP